MSEYIHSTKCIQILEVPYVWHLGGIIQRVRQLCLAPPPNLTRENFSTQTPSCDNLVRKSSSRRAAPTASPSTNQKTAHTSGVLNENAATIAHTGFFEGRSYDESITGLNERYEMTLFCSCICKTIVSRLSIPILSWWGIFSLPRFILLLSFWFGYMNISCYVYI
jgi:hypothetical protein